MRYYDLLNFQHVMAWLFPALLFLLIFGLALAYSHLRADDSQERKKAIYGYYSDGLETKNSPFPIALLLIIAGTFIWGFFYIVVTGVLGVKI